MTIFQARPWGDNDTYLGPVTFARDRGYKHRGIVLASGSEDYPGARLRMSGFGLTMILALPAWVLRPARTKIPAKSRDAETVARLGRDWYWQIDEREIGFSFGEGGHFSVYFGRQTMDSSTEKQWGCFLPWTQWRTVRHSFYGRSGERLESTRDVGKPFERWQQQRAIRDRTPTVSFNFIDFDGEVIVATTRIEETETRFGANETARAI